MTDTPSALALPDAVTLDGTEHVQVSQSGNLRKATLAAVVTSAGSTSSPTYTNLTLSGILTESVTAAVTAGTTRTQNGATQLTKEVNNVTTATAPTAGTVLGDGVALPGPTSTPAVADGQDYKVTNGTSFPVQVYSQVGDSATINGIAGNVGVAIPRGDVAVFVRQNGVWNYEASMGSNGQLVSELAADSVSANAAGTQVGSAVAPIAEMVHIITATNTSAPYSSVSIPVAALPGTELYYENNAPNPVQIFPIIGGSDTINGLAANASIVIPPNATVIIACTLAGSWISNPYYNAVGALPGNINTQMGASTAATGAAKPGGNLAGAFQSATQGNGADTTDDVLFTFAIPASIFDQAGRTVNIAAMGDFAATANNKRIKLWWGTTTQTPGLAVAGGVVVADSGVVTTNNGGWNLTAQIQKVGANGSNTQKGQGQIAAGSTHTGTQKTVQLTAVESGVINVTVTGASPTTGAANDCVGQTFNVAFGN